MRLAIRVYLSGLGACLLMVGWVQAQTSTVRVTESSDLSRPIFATAPAGDTERLFIAEQHTGVIRILDLNTGNLLSTPFLDINGLATGGEQGLLGLAFDPNYASNGYFYVNVTTSNDGGDTHIRRYSVQGNTATSNIANPNSQFEILSFNQPQGNHNGGWIGFSPTNDDYLYIASGDGGAANDFGSGHTDGSGNAQDLTNNLLGKTLRIDIRGDDFANDANRNYAIPASNPFANTTGDDEIWSYGLRNPYRSSFDRATGDFWIGDVGQGRREEINFQPADSPGGENYGWRLREGIIPTPTAGIGGNRPAGNVEPIYDYDHLSQFEPDPDFRGSVVIGGYVYRGSVPAFQGHYLFSDAGSGNIWKLDPDAVDPRASVTRINGQLLPDVGFIGGLSSFSEDAQGELYLLELGGEIYRVKTSSQDAVWNGNDPTAGNVGDAVNWGNANNWTRGGSLDTNFVTADRVVFVAGSSQTNVNLGSDRTVSAVQFQSSFRLQGNRLRVLSGNLEVSAGVTATIASDLEAESVNHSLRKLGLGTLLIENAAGQAVVKAGTLGGTGTLDYLTVESGATVAPGASVGELTVSNTFSMEAGAALAIEIGGVGQGQFDQLTVNGTAELDGFLDISLVDGFIPSAGDRFDFLQIDDGFTGSFEVREVPSLGPNLELVLDSTDTVISLLVNSTLEGDFNNDGDVDADDLTIWQANFGNANASRATGDADGDQDVDGADFLIFQRQFTGGQQQSVVTVPEPGVTLLVLLSALTILSSGPRGALRA